VPRLEQSGQREVVCASVTGTGNQKLQRLQRFFSMPGKWLAGLASGNWGMFRASERLPQEAVNRGGSR
jgi:hypothetical protein